VGHPEPTTPVAPQPYEPRRPTLIATAAFTLWPLLLSLPMFAGIWPASHIPANMGSDSNTGHRAKAAVSNSTGRSGA